jgi:hypothetical protein
MTDIRNWEITVDYVEGQGWEACVSGTSHPARLHVDDGWATSDPHTLMASVGRDLAAELDPWTPPDIPDDDQAIMLPAADLSPAPVADALAAVDWCRAELSRPAGDGSSERDAYLGALENLADAVRPHKACPGITRRAPLHVRIVQGPARELIADLPDWPYPVPRQGDYIFHPPYRPGQEEGTAGSVKTVTRRTHDRPADPAATSFVQTASPYIEISI